LVVQQPQQDHPQHFCLLEEEQEHRHHHQYQHLLEELLLPSQILRVYLQVKDYMLDPLRVDQKDVVCMK
jgi:hypothetical protein